MEEIPVIRVAILGAESSGKSTLAEALARQYGASWVPEYLREFVDTAGRVPFEYDQALIARTQRAREDEALAAAKRFLFCDTTPLMTALYSHEYWGRVDPATAALAAEHNYDHTFVTAPDSPWEADGLQRESDEVRQRIHRCVLDELARRGIPYVLFSGTLEERLRLAESILGTPSLG